MASNSSRGGYYRTKTKKYYEDLGYHVVITEFMCGQVFKGRCFYKKIDILGADGIAMKKDEIIFWNSKSTITGSLSNVKSSGKKDFAKYPFPPFVKRQLVIWEPRSKPVIIDCNETSI